MRPLPRLSGQLTDVPIAFKYDSFPSPSHLQLNGDATLQNPQLRITDNTDSVVGSAFRNPAVTLSNLDSFSTYFEFLINNPVGGGNGGDGLMFVVQAVGPTALGVGGGDLGYGGLPRSFGVEFDTYQDPSQGDLDDQHLGTHSNGAMTSHLQYAASPTNWLGGPRDVWIEYDGPTQHLEVRVNFTGRSRPAQALLAQTINLASVLQSTQLFVGFTAATGSNTDRHFVNKWYFNDDATPIDVVNNTYVQTPTAVVVLANPTSGAQASGITVIVEDADGNVVPGIGVTLTTTLGSLDVTSGTTGPDGRFSAVLTAGGSAGRAHVVSTAAGGLNGSVDVGLLANPAATVFFSITAVAGPGGQVQPSGVVAVASGASQSFQFTPDAVHQVEDVQVDGASVGAVAEYTFTNVDAVHTASVRFEEGTKVAPHRLLDVGFACSGAPDTTPRCPLGSMLLIVWLAQSRARRVGGGTRAAV